MANRILTKKSSTAGAQPTSSDLDVGELAVNTSDGKLFTKHTDDSIVQVVGSGGGTGGTTNLTAGVIWDNHDASRDEYDETLTVATGATTVLTHVADASDLRSVYIEKFVEVAGNSYTPSTTKLVVQSSLTDNVGLISITNSGVVLSSAQQKWTGYDSLAFPLSSSLSVPIATGTDDFTIEFWAYTTSVPTYTHYWDSRTSDGNPNGFAIATNPGNWAIHSTGFVINGASAPVLNTWQHVAFVKSGNNHMLFVDGSQQGATWVSSTDFSNTPSKVGGYYAGDSYPFNGYMDDLIVSVGVAKYTASFTPPTSRYEATYSVASTHWQLETYNDWGVQFTDEFTTTITNNTGADATARFRITAPTASAGGTGGGATTLAELTDSTTATTDPLITSNQAVGHFWINSTSGEAYICTDATTDENVWVNIGEGSGAVAPISTAGTGGTVTTDATYKYHAFTSSGDFVVTAGGLVDYLVVGGGGGGANLFGGGGAGGVLASTDFSVTEQTYSIVIGAGGAGGAASNGTPYNGANGADSSFATLTALGGGGGGANSVGVSGGSGGGGGDWAAAGFAGGSGTSGQGYAGGSASGVDAGGGAGGGATAVGGNGTSSAAGSGGAGLTSSISGSIVTYATGGNGGSVYLGVAANGADGSNNIGNGGGGGSRNPNEVVSGGDGGSGIVILRYAL
jgi:hypothetical protein